MKIWLMIGITLITPNIAIANVCGANAKVEVIKQGQVAPCDGFFFPSKDGRVAIQAKKDIDYYKGLVPKLEDRIKAGLNRESLLDERLKLYMMQSNVLATQKVSSDSKKFWQRLGYFALGIGVMYGGYQAAQATNR